MADALRMSLQERFTLDTFPFIAALKAWATAKNYRWRDLGISMAPGADAEALSPVAAHEREQLA